ncbi:FixH family protein [Psychroflexus sp. CAK57W]|uniref:FixH family protein n=1 Tax=Psychroflexus curvus TaxID=2873595 RepID=UPI001CCBE9F3|nr:FixH family protein [Psychroflexus curvus]MBZ9627793.1 FixH family protein [Psychroflexus curvus]MBZ9787470.1 FixH family protein [Psychroflexus curvus]
MKLNWGTSIVIAFVVFIGFIMVMVVQMLSSDQLEYDLVVESYYQKELTFQDDLDSAQNAEDLDNQVNVEVASQGVQIIFPSDFDYSQIQGEVYLYRPSDKALDFTLKLHLEAGEYVVPRSLMQDGLWEVNLKFSYKGEDYFIQKKIRI